MIKKDRILKFGVAVVFISLLVVGGSIAYFRAETASNNTMSSTGLKIALMEKGYENEISNDSLLIKDIVPGATVEKELYVKNLKESPSYIRVTLTKYWENNDGNKLPELDAQFIELATQDTSNWIIQDNDENSEVVYMYYKLPLNTNDETKPFLNQLLIGRDGRLLNNEYSHLNVKLDIEVDAIQQYAAQQAILSEWGLDVSINDQGIIRQVEE